MILVTLEFRKEDELTFGLVQNKIIAEYERRLHDDQSSNATSDSILKTVARVGRCYFCKKAGHQKQNCIKYKQWTQKQDRKTDGKVNNFPVKETPSVKAVGKVKAVNERECEFLDENSGEFLFALFSMGNARADDWLLDSVATRNACCNESAFETLDMSYKSSLEIANGELVPVEVIGSLKLKFWI